MDERFKKALHDDPRFKLALAQIPKEQHAMFEQVVLKFAEQFHTDVLQKFAEHVTRATRGDE